MAKTTQGIPHETSQRMLNFKKEQGLPAYKELQEKVKGGLVEQVDASIMRMAKFAEAQRMIFETIHGAGWDVTNVFHNIIDLQNKKLQLEEELTKQGINPLLSPEWVKANEMLTKQIEFVHKHKLELNKFNYGVQKSTEKRDDDLFTVEGKVDD